MEDNHDQLREEIQRDRLAMMEAINSGFDRLMDRFDEHAQSDNIEFSAIKERLTAVESTTKTVANGLVGTILAFVGAAFTWFFGKF